MAHGNFMIEVIKSTDKTELFEYSAPTYPQTGEWIKEEGRSLLVVAVNHILRTGVDGNGAYTSLQCVQVVVAK